MTSDTKGRCWVWREGLGRRERQEEAREDQSDNLWGVRRRERQEEARAEQSEKL